jgi:hypothetical protein
MSHSDYRTLVDRGRKAGLQTSELYRALTTRPPERQEIDSHTDTNGFIAAYDDKGHRIYRPSSNGQ